MPLLFLLLLRLVPHGLSRLEAQRWTKHDAGPPIAVLELHGKCEVLVGKGRVRCTADVSLRGEGRIAWGDVTVQAAPAFTRLLKGRLSPLEAVERTDGHWRWEFGLAGERPGEGDLVLEGRAVVCSQTACRPQTVSDTVRVVVE